MRNFGQLAALAIVVCVVLAGCSGGPDAGGTTTAEPETADVPTTDVSTTEPPEGTETADTTTTDAGESIEVQNGKLPVDPDPIFERVQRLLGTDVEPQPVEVRNLTERKDYAPGEIPFFQLVGIENASLNESAPGGLTTQSGKIFVHPGDGSPEEVERVLAHEFVHLVQYRANMFPWMSAIEQPRLTHDLIQTRLALVEGGAVYVTDAYAAEYLDGIEPAAEMETEYRDGGSGERYFFARYHFGYRYVSDQIDSSADLDTVYEGGPNTTEQVLHGYAPEEEPPADLSVAVGETDDWTASENDTMGELFVRIVLSSELDEETAASAAEGWGNDVLYGFERGDEEPGFAWTFRWDSPGEADEFGDALEDYLDGRREATDAAFRAERLGEETVVLFVGNPAFVENATASESDGKVTVSVG